MLTGNGVKRDRIERIHNGIHIADYTVTEQERLDAREAVRKEFSLSADCRIITYVGRLSPEKGVEVLVDAFRTLCISTENVACLLVGDGVQREELQARINSYPCKEKIILVRFRSDIMHLLAGRDVFKSTSMIKGLSLSMFSCSPLILKHSVFPFSKLSQPELLVWPATWEEPLSKSCQDSTAFCFKTTIRPNWHPD